jgi:hypothetical protein
VKKILNIAAGFAPPMLWATNALAQQAAGAAEAVDDIRDVHGPVLEAAPWWQTLPALLLAVAVAIALFLVARAIVRYFSRPKTAAEIALARIVQAQAKVQQTGVKAFAYEVTEATRAYIEARFSVHAPSQTTEELLDELAADASSPLGKHREQLAELLRFTDLVKYAGADIGAMEIRAIADAARSFIERARDDEKNERKPEPSVEGGAL